MNPVLLHLLFVVAGIAIALAALHWYARVSGGWFSLSGLFALAFLAVAVLLVLAGFGVVEFPGLGAA